MGDGNESHIKGEMCWKRLLNGVYSSRYIDRWMSCNRNKLAVNALLSARLLFSAENQFGYYSKTNLMRHTLAGSVCLIQ